ncbi:Autophagy-related protein [Pseudocercospora fuligena]|uniref:Autophagy-related protein 29 n=1 Tax=Pseudocercospora fuligena TaxID=685502 RepID=A0A8H6RNC7_9PEZI|nr:Autophagy-related protein [Pseudocercospora fuligena]
MSPSSSAAALPSHVRSRQSSNTTPVPDPATNILKPRPSSRPQSPNTSSPSTRPAPQYTVFVRLPFVRGSFQDPAPSNWNATKDKQLWKLISKASSNDLDWEGLSHDFDVELSFLLMQAAWLTERHMERMRKQVGRIGGVAAADKADGTGSGSAAGSVGGVKMERTGSRDSKMPSGSVATTVRRGSPSYPSPLETGGLPGSLPGSGTPISGHPPISRTPSSATVTQSKISGSIAKQLPLRERALRGSSGSTRRPARLSPSAPSSPRDDYYEDAIEHEGTSESESEEEPSAMSRSQAFRRPLIAKKAKPSLAPLASDGDEEADEDDDSSPGGYLPFAGASKSANKEDVAATIRGSPKKTPQQPAAQIVPRAIRPPARTVTTTTESSASSASSAAVTMHRQLSTDSDQPRRSSADIPSSSSTSQQRRASVGSTAQRPPGPLSPRHRAQLASLSPRSNRRDGSEGSPSMGSSFSDLDDASVTQSALEDALMSNMRAQGGSTISMAGRMSSLRDALGRRHG